MWVWRDTKKPSVLQTWNAYWEKDYFCKHEGYFYYKAYTGKTRVLKLDPFATITEVKAAIEQKEGGAACCCCHTPKPKKCR